MVPFGIHPVFLIIVLAIVLIIFGPGKLPELGGAIGRSMREFRKASSDLSDQVKDAIHKEDFSADPLPKIDHPSFNFPEHTESKTEVKSDAKPESK